MDIIDLVLKISQIGSVGLLTIAVYGAAKGWWVPRWIYDEAVKREAAVWQLYEREKKTSEALIAGQERRLERSV